MRIGTEFPEDTPKRQRGRPRGFSPETVLERVRDVFMQKGFAAASLDELSEAAGLNRPSLYAAFGDKEQLYIATLRYYGGKGAVALESMLGGRGSIVERLNRVYAAAVGLYTAPPHAPGCMIIGTATVEAPTRPAIAAAAVELLAANERCFERAFEQAVAERELSTDPSPATRARMAGAVLDTLAIRARLGTAPADLRTLAVSMVSAICR